MTQLSQLASAAGRQQNLVLWLLGATGWVVAGVLAGILIARGEPEGRVGSASGSELKHEAASLPTSEPARGSPGTVAPTPPPEPPGELPVVDAAKLPTVQPPVVRVAPKPPPFLVAPAPSSALAPTAQGQGVAPAPPPPVKDPASGESINSPGF
jgi:hypothetical protein